MIDPKFFSSAKVGRLTNRQRVLLIGIISNADDEGRLVGEAAWVRSQVFPYDEVSLDDMADDLCKLQADGTIIQYEVDGDCYIQLVNWGKYQYINRPKPSLLPSPPGFIESRPTDVNTSRPESRPENVDHSRPMEKNRIEKKRKVKEADPSLAKNAREVFDKWKEITHKTKAKWTNGKKERLVARLREGWSVEDLVMAAESAWANPWNQGENPTGKKYLEIDNIYRNSEKVEYHIENHGKRKAPADDKAASQARALAEKNRKLREGAKA